MAFSTPPHFSISPTAPARKSGLTPMNNIVNGLPFQAYTGQLTVLNVITTNKTKDMAIRSVGRTIPAQRTSYPS